MHTATEIHAPSNIGMTDLPRIVGTHKCGKDKWLTKHGLVFGDPFKEDRKEIRRQLGGFKPAFNASKKRKDGRGRNWIKNAFKFFRKLFVFRNQNR